MQREHRRTAALAAPRARTWNWPTTRRCRWSVEHVTDFWQAMWDHFDLRSPTPHRSVLSGSSMPGVHWFDGARSTMPRRLRHAARPTPPACRRWCSPTNGCSAKAARRTSAGARSSPTRWPPVPPRFAPPGRSAATVSLPPQRAAGGSGLPGLRRRSAPSGPHRARHGRGHGARPLPPDRAQGADRLRRQRLRRQDGGRSARHRGALLRGLAQRADAGAGAPTWTAAPMANRSRSTPALARPSAGLAWGETADLAGARGTRACAFRAPAVDRLFERHRGLPKPIVHGHGGVVLEMLKLHAFHLNLQSSPRRRTRHLWYSSTGWVMWNLSLSRCCWAPRCASTTATRRSLQPDTLWRFGASARDLPGRRAAYGAA